MLVWNAPPARVASASAIGHGFESRGDSDRQLVGQAKADQAQPVDGIASDADLIGVMIRDCHTEIGNVLGCLAQRGRVDPAECEGRLVTKERRGDGSPLGRGYVMPTALCADFFRPIPGCD